MKTIDETFSHKNKELPFEMTGHDFHGQRKGIHSLLLL